MAEFRQQKIKVLVAPLLLLKTEDHGKQDTLPIAKTHGMSNDSQLHYMM